MFKIQTIDIIAIIVLLIVILASILLRFILKRKLKDIEGDSAIYVINEEDDFREESKEGGIKI